jgi:predicted porin
MILNKFYAGLTLFITMPGASFAQSTITLYGVIDTALSYQTHTNPNGESTFGMQQGNEGFLSGGRFGFKGNEDLGNGWRAGFTLENGLKSNNGGLDQQGQLFGRQALVRLGHKQYGDLAFGRQYTTANTMLYYVDPLGVGAAPSNSWMVYLTGQRYDNSVSYTGGYGPLQVIAQYALGGIADDSRARSSASLGVKYASGPIVAIGDAQLTRDTQSRRARIYMAGLKASVGPVNLFANYLHSDRDAGFDVTETPSGKLDFASITSMSLPKTYNAAINSIFSTHRRDDFFTVGASYLVAPTFSLTASVMSNRTHADNFNGTRTTAYGVADYYLSKRTDLYLAAAYDWVGGSWSGLLGNSTTNWNPGSGKPLDGKNNQVSAMVGLRHAF